MIGLIFLCLNEPSSVNSAFVEYCFFLVENSWAKGSGAEENQSG